MLVDQPPDSGLHLPGSVRNEKVSGKEMTKGIGRTSKDERKAPKRRKKRTVWTVGGSRIQVERGLPEPARFQIRRKDGTTEKRTGGWRP